MAEKACIIHNKKSVCTYSKLKDVTDVTQEKLMKAKLLWLNHSENSMYKVIAGNIPSVINNEKHGIHHNPCYKHFVGILYPNKKRAASNNESDELLSPARAKRCKEKDGESTSGLFKIDCYFSNKNRIKQKGNTSTPITIATKDAENSIEEAAESDQTIHFELLRT